MKTWLHEHLPRRQNHDAVTPSQRHKLFDPINVTREVKVPNSYTLVESAAKIAASQTASRMSIERYLQAPLEDEPASVPAISAALKQQQTPVRGDHRGHFRGGSLGTSYDANSEGRRTIHTSASGQETTGTSFSVGVRSSPHPNRDVPLKKPQLIRLNVAALENANAASPENSATTKTPDSAKTLTELQDTSPLEKSVSNAYRARIEAELAYLQQRARLLETQTQRMNEQRENEELLVPRITDELAYEQMASNPKLAWILGTDGVGISNNTKLTTSAKMTGPVFNQLPNRPSTSGRLKDDTQTKLPRKSKSSSALGQEPYESVTSSKAIAIERTSSKGLRFFCTFCRKRFHYQTEWMNHERTVHMPEELWICCPPLSESLDRCPFCAQSSPSSLHLKTHNYMTCSEKPLSERTFNRKDHFLQHLAQHHNVRDSEKPFRLTELSEAWRHPLTLNQGHLALHCGFCGLVFPSYQERTEHISRHFMKGADMMSWWNERVSHAIDISAKRMQDDPCRYCNRTYDTLDTALKSHPVCTMWSCSFLPGMQYTIYPSGARPDLEVVCCYCNESLAKGNGRVKGTLLRDHISAHNFRDCNQKLYFSAQRFRQHLRDGHKTNYDGTLFAGWTLLLKSCEQQKTAVFEQCEGASLQRAHTYPEVAPVSKNNNKTKGTPEARLNFMDISETPQTSSASRKRIRRKPSAQTMPDTVPHFALRDSTVFFTRAATIDVAYGKTAAPWRHGEGSSAKKDRPTGASVSHPAEAAKSGLKFYRKRLESPTRNRLYIRHEVEGPLTKSTQKLFQKIPTSTFGSLVLHSSLLAATPARLTNSIDVYTLE